jgi:hypothetical protein
MTTKNQEPGGRALPVREAVATQEAVEAAAAEEDSDSNNMPRTFSSMTTNVLFMCKGLALCKC